MLVEVWVYTVPISRSSLVSHGRTYYGIVEVEPAVTRATSSASSGLGRTSCADVQVLCTCTPNVGIRIGGVCVVEVRCERVVEKMIELLLSLRFGQTIHE